MLPLCFFRVKIENNADIENNKPIKSGLIGIKFLNCFNSAKRIYALGKTEKNYYFELHGSNGVKYYYDFRTTGERVVRLSRWLKKTKYGYEGSGANYSTECLIRNLE